jgi:hypothetical protein
MFFMFSTLEYTHVHDQHPQLLVEKRALTKPPAAATAPAPWERTGPQISTNKPNVLYILRR